MKKTLPASKTTRDLHKYQRAAILLKRYPDMPETVIAMAIGDMPTKGDGTNYERAAALLDYDPDMPAQIIADAIGCSVGSAYCYRSSYGIWESDAELMRLAANEKSRISKAKSRELE